MADVDYDDFGGDAGYARAAVARGPEPGRIQRIVNGAGALTSVALVAGLAVWGYQLAVRDVTGIPVIRALEGPARVAPENPGGELARHRGLAVNAVAAEGEAAPPAERLVLAPKPVDLTEGDRPIPDLVEASATAPAEPEVVADPVLAAAETGAALPAATVALEPDEVIPADVPGVARSLRPHKRPGGAGAVRTAAAADTPAGSAPSDAVVETAVLADPVAEPVVETVAAAVEDVPVDPIAEAAAAAVAAALAPQALDVDPAALGSGARVVQLGTYKSADEARADWERIAAEVDPLLSDKQRLIELAESGGERFYRLRAAGFTDGEDARRFCLVMEDQGARCTPAEVQ